MQTSEAATPVLPARPPLWRRIFGREMVAWSVIALIALAAVFIQSCPDHVNADELNEATWSSDSAWAAFFNCPIHQTFIIPPGAAQGS